MSSKEIAGATGLSPQTVDTYIKVAMGRLGASNKREAARMLFQMEGSQELGSPSSGVATASIVAQQGGATGGSKGVVRLLPPLGGKPNDLDIASRTFAMMRVAAFSAVVVIAVVLLMAGALRAFR